MFNVVADQLKVSQGWVRCGQCSDIFDASLHLQDASHFKKDGQISTEPASPGASAVASAGIISDESTGTLTTPFLSPSTSADTSLLTPIPQNTSTDQGATSPAFNDDFAQSLQAAVDASASTKEIGEQSLASQPAPLNAALVPVAEAMPVPLAGVVADSARALINEEIEAEESAAAADSASFVQAARRQAFWKKLWVRAVLIAVALCLMAALLLQVVLQQKDQLVMWAPPLKPWVEAVCKQAGCQLSPLRKIDAVVIDSSTFSKLGVESYKLNFSIRNLSGVAVAMPSLEITLTDSQDQALLRRVFLPSQFGAGTGLLVPNADFAGSITLDVSALTASRNAALTTSRVAGYRLLAFYP